MEKVKVCRFCLCNNKFVEYIDLFSDLPTEFLVKINDCISLQVIVSDGLPIFGCVSCIEKIDAFNSFKQMCYNSYEQLIESKKSLNTENNQQCTNEYYLTNTVASDSGDDDGECTSGNYDKNSQITGKPWLFSAVHPGILEIIGNNTYDCDICTNTFDAFTEYQDHQETHNGEFVFKCDKCDMIFDERKLLVQHDYKHLVPCEFCQLKVQPSSLKAHQLSHTDIHKCSICNMRYTSKASLDKHIRARHTKEKGLVCHVCGKQNSCQSSMNRHMAYHSNERPYKCKYCDFSAKSLNIVQVHTSRKHFAEKCVCEICAKIFKSLPSLIQHTKRIHSDRRHVCTICGKEFIEKYNLNKHMQRHVGQRLHECKVCQREFFTVRKLKEHMHSHKQGCVSCLKCGKEFFYKKYLSKHLLKCDKQLL